MIFLFSNVFERKHNINIAATNVKCLFVVFTCVVCDALLCKQKYNGRFLRYIHVV